MYHPRVVAAKERAILAGSPTAQEIFPQGVPTYTIGDSAAFTAQLIQIYQADGTLSRALTPDEAHFLSATRLRVTYDFTYWAERFCWIDAEGHGIRPLYPLWESQRIILDRLAQIELEHLESHSPDGILINILKARQLGACLDPDTRILTADLQWVRLDDVQVGAEIVAVDEFPPGGKGAARRMRTAVVEGKADVYEPAFEISFDNGQRIVATGDHRFLYRLWSQVQTCWRPVRSMRVGDYIRHATEPWGDPTLDDAWFGGLLDGEGCLHGERRKSSGAEINVAQVEGPVFARAEAYLRSHRYTYRIEIDKGQRPSKFGSRPVNKLCVSRMDEVFRLIGQTRPTRFVSRRWWEGKELPGKRVGFGWRRIVGIQACSVRRMVDLQTSAKTFIAEGLVSHNSTLAEALVAHRVLIGTHVRAMAGADVEPQAGYLFRMVARLWDQLPWFLQPARLNFVKDREMVFSNGSQLKTAWGKSTRGELTEQAGRQKGHIARGQTYSCVHISELSTWENASQLDDALLPAVPIASQALVIFESTAKGAGNWWHQQWLAAEEGVGRFKNVFIPWGAEPTKYSLPAPAGWEPKDTTLAQAKKAEEIWPRYIGKSITLTPDQLYFYETTRAYFERKGEIAKFFEEYACLDGGTRVGTARGIIPLREVCVGDETTWGTVIHAGQTGVRAVWEVLTEHGRVLIGTPDHRVFLADGQERAIQDLCVGDAVQLQIPCVSSHVPRCVWRPLPAYGAGFDLTEDWALFLGYFMGDGAYYKDRILFACDSRDVDVVEEVRGLLRRLGGKAPTFRQCTQHGCALSLQSISWRAPFEALGVLRIQHEARKRWVKVPELVWRAPHYLIRLFLSALFECDGHRYTNAARIGLFAKDVNFLRDVQQLVLSFGITSIIRAQKRVLRGRTFQGWTLDLPAESARAFQGRIGFRSARKSRPWVTKFQWRPGRSRRANILIDHVTSVRPLPGERPVYDLTTADHRFDAGGILVHNSDPEECFLYSGRSVWTLTQLETLDRLARPLLDIWRVEPAREIAELRRSELKDPDPIYHDRRPAPPLAPRLPAARTGDDYPVPPGYGFRRVWNKELTDLPDLKASVLSIWEYPRVRGPRRYILGVDVSDGLGQDYSVVDVIRLPTLEEPAEQVAQYVSNQISPTQLAFVCDAIGRFYADEDGVEACAAIECNNHGLSTQDTLQLHLGYSHFYVWEYADSASPDRRFSTKIGWLTTTRTRPLILDKFYEATTTLDPLSHFTDLRLNSPITRGELRHFLMQPGKTLGEAEAAVGQHDDAILAGAIAYYVAYRHAGGETEPIAERRRRRDALKVLTNPDRRPDYRNTATTAEEQSEGLDHDDAEYEENPGSLHFDPRSHDVD